MNINLIRIIKPCLGLMRLPELNLDRTSHFNTKVTWCYASIPHHGILSINYERQMPLNHQWVFVRKRPAYCNIIGLTNVIT